MNKNRIIEIFLQLIKINALSSKEKPLADYIVSFLKRLQLDFYVDSTKNKTNSNTGNVVCRYGNGGSILLSSHMDTARPTEKVNPIFKNGKITSDGSTVLGVDNRAGIAVILALIESVKKNSIKTIDFSVAFTTCEETTIAGSKFIELNEKINKAYVFDSYMRPGKFVSQSSGAITFEAVFLGKAAHAGIEPEQGINAVSIAAGAINKIRQGWINDHTSLNIGIMSGGTAVNVVPEKSFIKGEIRSSNHDEINSVLSEVKEKFNAAAGEFGGSLEFSHVWDFEPFEIDPHKEVYTKLKDAMGNIGLTFQPEKSMGGSDANSYNSRGIEALNLGIGAQNPHSNDEFIFVEDLEKSYELAFELIKR